MAFTGALREVQAAWGRERWAELDSDTKTKLWTLKMKGADGWEPPRFPEAPSPAEVAAEVPKEGAKAQAPEKEEEDDGLSGLAASLALGPSAAAPSAAPATDEAAVPEEAAVSGEAATDEAAVVPDEAAAVPGEAAVPDAAAVPEEAVIITDEAAVPDAAAVAEDDGLEAALSALGLGSEEDVPPAVPRHNPFLLSARESGPAWRSLRDYQRALVLEAEAALGRPGNRTAERPFASALLSLATGGGKTRVAAALLERLCAGKRALFVVNRTVLAAQARAALRDFAFVDERDDGFSKPFEGDDDDDDEEDSRPRVTVATIQALQKAKAGAPLGETFAAVVVDEAHGAAADSYLGLLFRGLAASPGVVVIGLTATPYRLTRDAVLGSAFGGLARGPEIHTLVAQGSLATPRILFPDAKDRLAVRALRPKAAPVAGEAPRGARADRALDDADAVALAVRCWKRAVAEMGATTAVAFCRDIKHSLALRDALRDAGVAAEHVDGSTKDKARREALADLGDRRVSVLCNASLLCEGFDEPSLSAVILLRKTDSPALYAQQVGRALRSHPGKAAALVVDVVGNSRQHARALFGDQRTLDADDGGALAKHLADHQTAATGDKPPNRPKQKANRDAAPPPPPDLVPLGRRAAAPPRGLGGS